MWVAYIVWPPKLGIANSYFGVTVLRCHFECFLDYILLYFQLNYNICRYLLIHGIESKHYIQYSHFRCQLFISDPKIVDFDLMIEMQMDWQPNSHCVHEWRPIPRILIASFAGVCILKRHPILALLFSIIGFC